MKRIYKLLLLITLILSLLGCGGQSDEEIKEVVERIENVSGKTDEQKYMDLYVTGLLWENKDVKTAEKYYLEAARYKKSAYADIGRMYYRKVNKKKGIEKYKEGWGKGDLESAYELGVIYDRYEKKSEEAEKWWEIASENGHAGAMFNLGVIYDETNKKGKAIEWYKKSGELGNVKAQYNLGNLFININKYGEAEEWLKKAANQNDKNAQYNLGILYEEKLKDIKKARFWYSEAVKSGDNEAKIRLDKLEDEESE